MKKSKFGSVRINVRSTFVIYACLMLLLLFTSTARSQGLDQKAGITDTKNSPFAKLEGVPMQDVQWTSGFWADWFKVCDTSMIPNMWHLFNNDTLSHGYKNFKIAAGLDTGIHIGPPFMDGDFLKWLEGAAAVYAHTKSPELGKLMDGIIRVIAKAQRPDGYLGTQVQITAREHPDSLKVFGDTLSFEAYNLGHLMTTACVYYRATGKTTLLNVAEKAAGFLQQYYTHSSPTLARSAICPAHYMGVIELYRTTGKKKYLELAQKLMDLRDGVTNGTDQNQDRIPFRQQKTAVGHAVRANYLYAGAADVFLETGDSSLIKPLGAIWQDVVNRKMYITGGCGALYDGVSPDGTSYHPSEIQQVAQAYGRPYQLPNYTAHDETCANIGNMLWNWRMLQITADEKYADVLERTLYNSVLSGISLDGKTFLYANPLAYNRSQPFTLRWSELPRDPYIGYSFCCPPNVVRTIAEASDYLYGIGKDGLYLHLYGANQLSTKTADGETISIHEVTNYPWNGNIMLALKKMPEGLFTVHLRIPGWAHEASIRVNGKEVTGDIVAGSYFPLTRKWKSGDTIELELPMEVKLMAANPLVEANRGQVAIQRGPIVYCLESKDLPAGTDITDVTIDKNSEWVTRQIQIGPQQITTLETTAYLKPEAKNKNALYYPLTNKASRPVKVRLIPYYSWENRGRADMEVWLPLAAK
ncbi:aceric acid hydrolase [Arachidicoccus terrestris]|uniref:aceric acid hydrolase n=1 Tax=Arachidicoccus terrestris TaxID=2875539 RepID=UPI001CC661A2|nr:glycoside hydrolase family 127 protein [Arachidicoccus terrestris]